MHAYNGVLTILGLACFLYLVFCVSLKVKLTVHYYVFVCILPEKAIPEMTYSVSGGTLNPTHSLTHSVYRHYDFRVCLHYDTFNALLLTKGLSSSVSVLD